MAQDSPVTGLGLLELRGCSLRFYRNSVQGALFFESLELFGSATHGSGSPDYWKRWEFEVFQFTNEEESPHDRERQSEVARGH